ncbi:hypothetical protein Goshw_017919 [Gossypium schwendimanii]|uniref:DUF4283 domain-containing protein n=1 Tax=Gossypium schwendimanii TaxID=34291 RepID=A0A7J9MNX7_GOSSC|nr:hypothetical protein [Gossypium schwendimanii]
MEEDMTKLNITEEEEEPIRDHGEGEKSEDKFNLCLVGKVLTNSVVHFPSMRFVLADLWHPIEGVSITEIEDKRVLFRFYNELDLWRVYMIRVLVLNVLPMVEVRHVLRILHSSCEQHLGATF